MRIQKIRRPPDVPSDPDVNSLIPEPRERLADPWAIEYLRNEVFPIGKVLSLYKLQCGPTRHSPMR